MSLALDSTPPLFAPLVDRFGRVHTSLRVSVTDRCNIRCFYCMPAEVSHFLPKHELLSFEEITHFVGIVARLGVRQVRLTGGEPLLRSELPTLVRMLVDLPGVDEVTLTTNGILLAEQALPLRQAGLARLNISLDSLREETFQKISRRSGVDKILSGIFAAKQAGFESIRLNAVAVHGLTEPDVVPLAEFARQNNFELRFIEFMPLDADGAWQSNQVLTGEAIRKLLEDSLGPLLPADRPDESQPAQDYFFSHGGGKIGFINPVSEPFCSTCNRIRITAEGQLRNCLFSQEEWDARALLRGSAQEEDIISLVRDCIAAKHPGHGMESPDFQRPARPMYQIGG